MHMSLTFTLLNLYLVVSVLFQPVLDAYLAKRCYVDAVMFLLLRSLPYILQILISVSFLLLKNHFAFSYTNS